MKILITIAENHFPNPFVRTLADGLREQGVEVTCSSTDFWNNWESYDIIHIQWPQVLIKPGMTTIEPLREHFDKMKNAGKKIVVTCHNLKPHYSKLVLKNESYVVTYENADAVVHLGKYSYDLFLKEFPNVYNVIILHHIYDNLYKDIDMPSYEESIKKLHLDNNYRYILCMGAFRDNEERDLVQNTYLQLKNNNIRILAPSFVRWKFKWKKPLSSYKKYRDYCETKNKYPEIITQGEYIPDNMLPYYYAASDIALIHRKNILNSGNVPMALMMGKVIVGPNTGNVGPWLDSIKNPTFDVANLSTIKDAINEAYLLRENNVGSDNKTYAYKKLSTETISKEYVKLYNKILF